MLTESSVSGVSAIPLSLLVSWAISTEQTENTKKKKNNQINASDFHDFKPSYFLMTSSAERGLCPPLRLEVLTLR